MKYNPDFEDLTLIDTAISLLNSQFHDTLRLKTENLPQFYDNIFHNKLPDDLSEENCLTWARRPIWSADEAIILSLGLKPSEFIVNMLREYRQTSFVIFTFFDEYSDRFKMLRMAFDAHVIDNYPTPLEYLDWFRKMKYSFPENLRQTTFEIQSDEPAPTIPSNKGTEHLNTLSAKEKSSLLSLIHAMGHSKPYFYDANNMRNGAIGRIESSVLDAGLNLSQRTIKKYMNQACKEADRLKDNKN